MRLSGQDASFLYTETPTVLAHTVKIQIFDSPYELSDYDMMREWLKAMLDAAPMLRQRILFVPFNMHHPVLVDDPDFDIDSHIYRAALPAPGGRKELNQMISQILCHRLDRQRPLWELWILSGLEGERTAIVHKIHHCMADGAATVRYLRHAFDQQVKPDFASPEPASWQPEPLPSGWQLVRDAIVDHLKYDIRAFPLFVKGMWQSIRNLLTLNKKVGSPTVSVITHPPPRTRFNHVLSARRNYTTRQFALHRIRDTAHALEGTINDVMLAMGASAVRRYLGIHNELPDEPLWAAIPVSAEESDSRRESGNITGSLMVCLWTNIADPKQRFIAIQKSSHLAKEELEALGRQFLHRLLQFMPPWIYIWKTYHKQRKRKADRPDFRPSVNLILSNVPGPREAWSGSYGTLLDIYSMGTLVEGIGLNITAWSYAGSMNFSIMGCKKALPDIELLADALADGLSELEQIVEQESSIPENQ
jgi:diacylglycerol O-acyltransferase